MFVCVHIAWPNTLVAAQVWQSVVKCGSLFNKTSKCVGVCLTYVNICQRCAHLEILNVIWQACEWSEYLKILYIYCMKFVCKSEFLAVFGSGFFLFFYLVCCFKECRPLSVSFNLHDTIVSYFNCLGVCVNQYIFSGPPGWSLTLCLRCSFYFHFHFYFISKVVLVRQEQFLIYGQNIVM